MADRDHAAGASDVVLPATFPVRTGAASRRSALRMGFNIAPSAAMPDAMRRLLRAIDGFDHHRGLV